MGPRTGGGIVTVVAGLRIALIGYGEVGGIFGAALAKRGVVRVTAYDVLLCDALRAAALRARASADGVRIADSARGWRRSSSKVSSRRAATASRTPCPRRSPKRFPASTGRRAATISSAA
jgi:hypothetical protein